MTAALSFDFRKRFSIRHLDCHDDTRWIFRDSLSPSATREVNVKDFSLTDMRFLRSSFRIFLPYCIPLAPVTICSRLASVNDVNFWQFPAITERLANERHAAVGLPDWALFGNGLIHSYLGLPWASYIDKKIVPALIKQVFGLRLSGYRALGESWGLSWGDDVAIHTVCQHIYWQEMLPLWSELGITDVHLSHCEATSQDVAARFGIRVHAWPLAAVNVVNAHRREGLIIGKPLVDRALLASFIGAHMHFYRSDVRLRLRDEVARAAVMNTLFELKDDWHFNPMVYQAQVEGIPMTASQVAAERFATARYNAVLSDSVFSLCPEGAGPNTLRLWESLAVGAIPVVIAPGWIWPTIPGADLCWEDAVIMVGHDEVDGLITRLQHMMANEPERLAAMSVTGMRIYQRFESQLCFPVSKNCASVHQNGNALNGMR